MVLYYFQRNSRLFGKTVSPTELLTLHLYVIAKEGSVTQRSIQFPKNDVSVDKFKDILGAKEVVLMDHDGKETSN